MQGQASTEICKAICKAAHEEQHYYYLYTYNKAYLYKMPNTQPQGSVQAHTCQCRWQRPAHYVSMKWP